MAKQKLDFYDVKTKKKFNSDKWVHKKRGNRNYAVVVNPKSKVECWRAIGEAVLGKKPVRAKPKKACKKR